MTSASTPLGSPKDVHQTGASPEVGGVAALQTPVQLAASTANPPVDPGKSASSATLEKNVQEIAKKEPSFGGPTLQKYARNALATVKLMATAFKTMGDLFKEKWEAGGRLSAVVGIVFAGLSLLAQGAVKAAIWTPILLTTAAVTPVGVIIGGLIGMFGERGGTLRGAKLGADFLASTVGGVLGVVGTVVSGLSIVGRWPVMLTYVLGEWMLKSNAPKDKALREERQMMLDLAHQQTFQDTLSLWCGGMDSVWFRIDNHISIYHTENTTNDFGRTIRTISDEGQIKKEKFMLLALEAGADPYSTNWFEYNIPVCIKFFNSENLKIHDSAVTETDIDDTIKQLKVRVEERSKAVPAVSQPQVESQAPKTSVENVNAQDRDTTVGPEADDVWEQLK